MNPAPHGIPRNPLKLERIAVSMGESLNEGVGIALGPRYLTVKQKKSFVTTELKIFLEQRNVPAPVGDWCRDTPIVPFLQDVAADIDAKVPLLQGAKAPLGRADCPRHRGRPRGIWVGPDAVGLHRSAA